MRMCLQHSCNLWLSLRAPRAVQRHTTHHVSVPHKRTKHSQQHVGSTCRWPGQCWSSGSNQLQTRWCPSGPPTSWGIFLPTGSRVASSGWRYWGQPCSWGKREALPASACGAESDCRKRTRRYSLGDSQCVTILLQTEQDTSYLPPPPARSCFFSFFFSNIRTRRDLKSKNLSYYKIF